MRIIINENQLNLLVEKLGVPDLITKTSEKFYNLILNYLRPIGEETPQYKKIQKFFFLKSTNIPPL